MILEELREKYIKIQSLHPHRYKRYFLDRIDFNDKLIGIVGARGTGKTTALLQYLHELDLPFDKKLYVSVDSLLMRDVSLYDIADRFSKSGGKVLVIDEIHKYQNFEIELKEIYDFLDIRTLFSGSSAMQIEHSKADLSRRAVIYRIEGLSFREFLELRTGKRLPAYNLSEIIENHIEIAQMLLKKIKPFEFFSEYMRNGYFPYYFENKNTYHLKLEETVGTILESDLPIIFNIEPQNIQKLKQLVGLICISKPYELNIAALSKKIGINRNTLYQYINYLNMGKLFFSLYAVGKKDTVFTKPSKLYLNNTNLAYNYCSHNEIGMLRELFFIEQLRCFHDLYYPTKGDFLVDGVYTFEIGGKGKGFSQIEGIEKAYVAADGIEIGFGNKIPLWLFGFLY